jgi:predicted AlkP superfamily pyrophosphatase or phosphodiesterase
MEGVEGKPYIYDSAEDAIRDADEELEKLYKNLSKMYEPVIGIVSDHGQVKLERGNRYHVDLSEEFEKDGINAFTNLDPHEYEKRTGKKADVIFASSGPRMSHIYILNKNKEGEVFNTLQNLESVEFVFFRENGRIYLCKKGEIADIDEYEFGDEFPRASERIEGLMSSPRCGDFVITARKGYEFERSEYMGAHGGLHFDESTGFGVIHSPNHSEIVREGMITDIVPSILKILGVKNCKK